MASIALGLAAGLLLVELALRAAGLQPLRLNTKRHLIRLDARPTLDYHCYPGNPHGEFEPLPDLAQGSWQLIDFTKREYPLERLGETPWAVEYRRSAQGLRDREYSPQPPPGVVRIAAVGDSFTFGEGVPLERSLPRCLERQLGPGYEVVNAAQPGLSTSQEVALASRLCPQLGCSRAIVVFTANDVSLSPELAQRQNYINDLVNVREDLLAAPGSSLAPRGFSRLLQWIVARRDMRRINRYTVQWYRDCYDPLYNAAGLARLEADFRTLANWPECQVVLVLYPLLEGLEHGYPLQPVHERVERLARQAGLDVLDLSDVLSTEPSRELWVDDADHHPNGRAHALAAEAIAGWLGQVKGFLPQH